MVKKSKSKFMPKANFLGHLLSFALFFGMNKLLRVPLIWLLLKIQHTRCFLHTRVVLGSQWVWGFEFLANISIFQIKVFFLNKILIFQYILYRVFPKLLFIQSKNWKLDWYFGTPCSMELGSFLCNWKSFYYFYQIVYNFVTIKYSL